MADCSDSVQKRGSSNPIQSKIVENTHGTSGGSIGDNTILGTTCDSTVAVGNVVRLSGSTMINALANSFTNAKVIGICVAKSSSTVCDIQVTGFTGGLYGSLLANTLYFLSDTVPGGITTTPPTASGSVVQQIGLTRSITALVINITTGLIRA